MRLEGKCWEIAEVEPLARPREPLARFSGGSVRAPSTGSARLPSELIPFFSLSTPPRELHHAKTVHRARGVPALRRFRRFGRILAQPGHERSQFPADLFNGMGRALTTKLSEAWFPRSVFRDPF